MRNFYKDSSGEEVLGGVISGFKKSYDINMDISVIRLLFLLIAILTNVPFILTYLILWFILPESDFNTNCCNDCSCGNEPIEKTKQYCKCDECSCDPGGGMKC